MSKSYWMSVITDTDAQKSAVLSWLSPLCDDMQVESAEILCDGKTDQEKKIKAVVIDADGRRRVATRTKGAKHYTLTLSSLGDPDHG